MALRANVLAKGSPASASRRSTRCIALLNRGVHPRRAVARLGRRERRPRAARAPRAGADRRGRGARRDGGRVAGARRRCARAGSTPVALGAEGRAGAHQRHAAVDGGAGAGAGRRRAAGARRRHRRGAVDRRAARVDPSVRRAHPRGAAVRRAARVGRQHRARCCAGSGINALARATAARVQDAYSMRCAPQVHGAARDALALRPRHGRRSRPTPPPTTRWSSPTPATSSRAATSTARRWPSPPTCWPSRVVAARDDQRAADRSARQSGAQRPAGVPDARRRPAVGADDGAGDRGGARVGAEDARASGRRRHDPDVGEQGRPRQHEHGARR